MKDTLQSTALARQTVCVIFYKGFIAKRQPHVFLFMKQNNELDHFVRFCRFAGMLCKASRQAL